MCAVFLQKLHFQTICAYLSLKYCLRIQKQNTSTCGAQQKSLFLTSEVFIDLLQTQCSFWTMFNAASVKKFLPPAQEVVPDAGHGSRPGTAHLWNSHQLPVSGHQLPRQHSNAAEPLQLRSSLFDLHQHAALQERWHQVFFFSSEK